MTNVDDPARVIATLRDELEKAIRDRDEARHTALAANVVGAWAWMPDSQENDLASLSSEAVISMTAGTLRRLISGSCERYQSEVQKLRDALAAARAESDQLRAGLAEANSVIDGYGNDEPPIVRGALDAQAEAESMYYEVRAEAVQLRSERDYLKTSLERLIKERDHLKGAYALARCSWCDEPVCEQHAAPGEHPGCGRLKSEPWTNSVSKATPAESANMLMRLELIRARLCDGYVEGEGGQSLDSEYPLAGQDLRWLLTLVANLGSVTSRPQGT